MTGPEVVKEIKRYVSAISECAKRTERITELVAQMVSGATEEIPPENEEPELSEEGEVQKILNGISNLEVSEFAEPIIRFALHSEIGATKLVDKMWDNGLGGLMTDLVF